MKSGKNQEKANLVGGGKNSIHLLRSFRQPNKWKRIFTRYLCGGRSRLCAVYAKLATLSSQAHGTVHSFYDSNESRMCTCTCSQLKTRTATHEVVVEDHP